MADGRFAILDPAAGISGDMLLGALVAAGAPVAWLEQLPARLGAPDVSVRVESVDRCGVRATKVHVVLPDGSEELPAQDHSHSHGHGHHNHSHHHDGAHRHIGDLIRAVEQAPLSAWVRERAVSAFRLLGEAEGRVHGVPADDVALHEVGAVDALVDIVGAIEGFERLGITRIFNRPVAVGSGWVHAAHGVMPVPAPATALLLEGIEGAPNGPVSGEAVTPAAHTAVRAGMRVREPSAVCTSTDVASMSTTVVLSIGVNGPLVGHSFRLLEHVQPGQKLIEAAVYENLKRYRERFIEHAAIDSRELYQLIEN